MMSETEPVKWGYLRDQQKRHSAVVAPFSILKLLHLIWEPSVLAKYNVLFKLQKTQSKLHRIKIL